MSFQKTIHEFMTTYETINSPAVMADRYLMAKIQDGGQVSGSSNISGTVTYVTKIPTAILWHSTMANSQEVYQGGSNNERQSEMAAEKKILLYLN